MEQESKYQKIIEASLVLFADRGFDATTIPMIAEKADVGAGTIYRYFDSKEGLVNILFQDSVKHFKEKIEEGYPEDSAGIHEQFQHIFRCLYKFSQENIHALYFLEIDKTSHYLNETSRAVLNDLLDFIYLFFEKGKERGIIRSLPSHILSAMVFGSFVHIQKLVRAGEIEDPSGLMKEIEACSWHAIKHRG
ncbi:TetR/AcrR family transcriptional regulator [Bacillus swezeyi]|uniref:TetR family transcriptional regulator n=1 Tax=Bacillus swezeyi TaxID=1925020 RepID=A0A1R1QSH5_9BACI|nr:TetR/AcrR family transcriptional regulator [Bacillus swezeyi]MEC1261358.1 TetR/AcrR family transcriptional regulator [Bacillus swezeyi]MED2929169.1 TetR/AcrR family transcriptional regulator [Bacillus swezeyi]MED2940970.1 TetR/AcrR family transcriptional regulator [Bacillus swezeyi]MED2963802.1 TetR/AcrR family transcriptional regulator [Bacillus swezeyi]MED2975466.1 TetR/AcrR family transcriptional regulator [Bacillus swezeyi]